MSTTSESPAGDRQSAPPAVDRAAALAQGPPGIPRKFVTWLVVAAALLTLGGVAGEHIFSSSGLNPVHAATVKSPAATAPSSSTTLPATGPGRAVRTPLESFMGLSRLASRPAPPFTLTDQAGRPISMPPQPTTVVVLTFFDGTCNDICPVLGEEIRQADADLGALSSRVEFLTVNTDPLALAQSAQSPAAADTGLGTLPNWHMLTGPLATLNPLWKAYDVSISVDPKTGLEAHNEVLYLVDATGNLRWRATPFADESTTGSYRLPPATVARFARGIATYAGQLVGP